LIALRETVFNPEACLDHLFRSTINENKIGVRMPGERGRHVCERLVRVAFESKAAIVRSHVYGPQRSELVQTKKITAGARTQDEDKFIVGLIAASDLEYRSCARATANQRDYFLLVLR
jgi:hypothetical protein